MTCAHRCLPDGPRPGVPLTDIQWVLGHAHLSTTERYLSPQLRDVIETMLAFYEKAPASCRASSGLSRRKPRGALRQGPEVTSADCHRCRGPAGRTDWQVRAPRPLSPSPGRPVVAAYAGPPHGNGAAPALSAVRPGEPPQPAEPPPRCLGRRELAAGPARRDVAGAMVVEWTGWSSLSLTRCAGS